MSNTWRPFARLFEQLLESLLAMQFRLSTQPISLLARSQHEHSRMTPVLCQSLSHVSNGLFRR